MKFLIDHNIRGQAKLLLDVIINQGWLDVIEIRFVMFEEMSLTIDSSDRVVWRLAQANKMILLTANRSAKGKDLLEQVLREENTLDSLPVITIANVNRVSESEYRELCVNCLVEIALYVENYLGVRRIFIP
ncbi:ACP S-malonyltransferase [Chlorogloeopsis sp. ULAP02]|uniref:ACP S-malonyltransferase n=1 Tax=Chlorogloeopsis sp. ULAP02 TaxID=3107926 RepID=UPI0031376065